MEDALAILRLILAGDSAGAVAAIGEVNAAEEGLQKSQAVRNREQVTQQQANVRQARAGLGLMAAGVAEVALVAGFGLEKYKDFAGAVVNTQRATNLSAESASKLVAQWEEMGVSLDSAGRKVGRFEKNYENSISATSKGTDAASVAFKDLGLSMDQLRSMGADQALTTVRDHLASMQDHALRTKDALALFGRDAMDPDFLRWLTASKSQLEEINDQAKKLGLIFNQKDVDQAKEFGATLHVLEFELTGLGVSIGKSLAGPLKDMSVVLADVLGVFNELPGPMKDVLLMAPGFALFAIGVNKFAGALKASMQNGYDLVKSLQQIIGKQKILATTTEATTVATEEETVAMGGAGAAAEGEAVAAEGAATAETGLTGATAAAGLEFTAVAAGIMIDIMLLQKAWDAYNQMKQAQAQAKEAQQGASSEYQQQYDRIAQRYGVNSPQMQDYLQKTKGVQSAIAADSYQQSWYTKSPLSLIPHAAGGMGVAREPMLALIGEAGPEPYAIGEKQVAAVAGGSGSGKHVHLHVHGGHFYGSPDADVAERWAAALVVPLGRLLYDASQGSTA